MPRLLTSIAFIFASSFVATSIATPAFAAQGDLLTSIAGDQTELNQPWGVTADVDGKIYVANFNTGQVLVFAANAAGNVAPIARISDNDGFIDNLRDVEVDPDGNIYVASSDGIVVFEPGASGNSTPSRTITTVSANGLAVGHDGKIYVASSSDGTLNVFAANAVGGATPLAILEGNGDSVDVAVDNDGTMYLPISRSPHQIWVWEAGAQTGDVPDRSLGSVGSMDEPEGIDVDCSDGVIVVSSTDDNDIFSFDSDGLESDPGTLLDGDLLARGLGFGISENLYISETEENAIHVYEWETSCQNIATPAPEGLAPTGTPSHWTFGAVVAGLGAFVVAAALRPRRNQSNS